MTASTAGLTVIPLFRRKRSGVNKTEANRANGERVEAICVAVSIERVAGVTVLPPHWQDSCSRRFSHQAVEFDLFPVARLVTQ